MSAKKCERVGYDGEDQVRRLFRVAELDRTATTGVVSMTTRPALPFGVKLGRIYSCSSI
jgi:hypothetical protein